ncbi:MAG: hypothetical protein H6708_27815 [Kofleriaceae bacterium]|nr:hypothetical protein [Myxococcales bacterium]MCB9564216.1 hypothetical protein [Kofleriaceae bacterium]
MNVGEKLEDDAELLLRQVHPAFVRDGRPSSQVFRPTSKDAGMLSVNRGASTEPESAFTRFVARPGCRSCGVLAVSVAECGAEQLAAHDAPLTLDPDGDDDPSHAIVDFRGIAKNAVEKKSGRLVRVAVARGFLHGPVDKVEAGAGSSQAAVAADPET